MSYLNTFCILHFEEREEYSRMTKKGLELNMADFTINGYEVDEVKYPWHGSKEPSTSDKGKIKMDDAMTIDLSEDKLGDGNDNDDLVQLG